MERMRGRLSMLLIAMLAATLVPVAAAHLTAAPTMKASATSIGFGETLKLSGTAGAGASVELWALVCGFTEAAPIGTTKASPGGAYTFAIQPQLNSVYTVKVGDAASGKAPVKVRPLVQVRRVSAGVFAVDVSVGNGQWFTTKVALQIQRPGKKAWATVATSALKENSDPGALVAVSSTTIRKAVPRGSKVRATISQAAVGTCYVPAASAPIGA
jgi:hypothetical protein